MSWITLLVFLVLLATLLRELWRRFQQSKPASVPPPRPSEWPSYMPWPGEIWWAMVPFAEIAEAKDRPCLVLAVNGDVATVAPITTKYHPIGAPVALPPGSAGDRQGRQSYLRPHERRDIHVSDFRRQVGPVDPDTWTRAHTLS